MSSIYQEFSNFTSIGLVRYWKILIRDIYGRVGNILNNHTCPWGQFVTVVFVFFEFSILLYKYKSQQNFGSAKV